MDKIKAFYNNLVDTIIKKQLDKSPLEETVKQELYKKFKKVYNACAVFCLVVGIVGILAIVIGGSSDYEPTYSSSSSSSGSSYGSSYSSSSGSSYGSGSSSFDNKYGTGTTKCLKSGCNNYIASSGDSAYCTAHSNKCLECYCYIDGDAMYCMDCLTDAANDVKNDSYDYDYDYDYNYDYDYGYDDGYDYNPNDKYYSSNDYNNDGKISDSEFQGALNDYLNDYYGMY